MKRRSFLKILPAAAALSTWLAIPKAPRINPAWVNASYEAYFLFGRDAFKPLMPSPYRGISFGIDPHPLRFKL